MNLFQLLNWTVGIAKIIVYAFWIFLLVQLIVQLVRKNYTGFKRTLLVTFNTVVFVIGWAYIMILFMIVQFRSEATYEASIQKLNEQARGHLISFLLWSIFWTGVLMVLNFLYLKFICKKSDRRLLIHLAAFDFAILIACAGFSVLHYYKGMLSEIGYHFN